MHKRNTPTLAAFALGEPVAPVGYRRDGRPIFPIAGAEDPPAPTPPDAPPVPTPPPAPPASFEPITSQADLDKILGQRLAREREKFADYDDVKAKAAEHDKALEAARTDQEKAVEAARAEGRTEALATANTRLVSAEARALAAAAKFRNPALAVKAIDSDLASVKVADDGNVDADAIRAALTRLAEAEPYLVDDGKQVPRADPSQGGGGASDATSSVARGRDMYKKKTS